MLVVLRLGHAEPVTKRIFEYGFYPVELLGRLRQEFHAFGFEFLVGLPAVCCIECAGAQRALLDESDHRGHVLLLQLRTGRQLHENNLEAGLAFGRNREPTEAVGHGLVGVYLKAELVDVKIFGHVLIEDKDTGMRHPLNHFLLLGDCTHRLDRVGGLPLLHSCCVSVQSAKAGKEAEWRKDNVPGRPISEYSSDFALVLARRSSGHGTELVAEGAQAGVSNLHADFGDRHFAQCQEPLGMLHAQPCQVIVWSLAEGGSEQAVKVKSRQARLAGSLVKRYLGVIRGGEKVLRAAEPPECLVMEKRAYGSLRHGSNDSGQQLVAALFLKFSF